MTAEKTVVMAAMMTVTGWWTAKTLNVLESQLVPSRTAAMELTMIMTVSWTVMMTIVSGVMSVL